MQIKICNTTPGTHAFSPGYQIQQIMAAQQWHANSIITQPQNGKNTLCLKGAVWDTDNQPSLLNCGKEVLSTHSPRLTQNIPTTLDTPMC